MYHFENGYHAEIICEKINGKTECTIVVTGNGTQVKIVHLTREEAADCLVRIRDQRVS